MDCVSRFKFKNLCVGDEEHLLWCELSQPWESRFHSLALNGVLVSSERLVDPPVVCDVLPLVVVPIDCVVVTPMGDGEIGVLVLQALGAVHELLVVGQLPPVQSVAVGSISSSSRVKAMCELVTKGCGDKSSIEQGRRKTQRKSQVEKAVDETGLNYHIVVGG